MMFPLEVCFQEQLGIFVGRPPHKGGVPLWLTLCRGVALRSTHGVYIINHTVNLEIREKNVLGQGQRSVAGSRNQGQGRVRSTRVEVCGRMKRGGQGHRAYGTGNDDHEADTGSFLKLL